MATACLPFGMKGAKRCSQTAGRLFVQFLINSFSPLVRSFIRPSSCPSIHPFSTYSFVYPSNIYLLIHSFIHSFCGYLGGNGLTALREVLSGGGGVTVESLQPSPSCLYLYLLLSMSSFHHAWWLISIPSSSGVGGSHSDESGAVTFPPSKAFLITK